MKPGFADSSTTTDWFTMDGLFCYRLRMSSGSTTSPYPSDHSSAAASYKGGFARKGAVHRASKVLPSTPMRQSLSLLRPLSACYKAVDCSRWHPCRWAMHLSTLVVVVAVVVIYHSDDS